MMRQQECKKESIQIVRILVADDDPPTRILLRAAITQWGYEVVEAKDGEEAWQILQTPEAPRILILDWLMPKLDGIDLCVRVKKELSFHPYVILLTQMTGTTNVIKGLDAGADEFLSKPFNMAELRSRLSVASRIIKYEKMLAEQNIKLQTYSLKLETLSSERQQNIKYQSDLLNMLCILNILLSLRR